MSVLVVRQGVPSRNVSPPQPTLDPDARFAVYAYAPSMGECANPGGPDSSNKA